MHLIRRYTEALVMTVLVQPAVMAGTLNESIDTSIEEVTVLGRAQEFYLKTDTNIGSKIDIDIIDLPQSAQILTKQLIIDQAARDITDLYRSIAGVSEFSYSGVTFRGFRDSGNVFYDGVRGDPFSGFSVPQLFNVERVEILKGPAAALYGGGEPGGMINYVTKQATFDQKNELVVTTGNYDLWGASFDSTGPLSDNLAYRVAGFYEEQDSFRANADHKNLEFSGGLLFQPTDSTSISTNLSYVDQDLGGHRLRGVRTDDNGNFIVPISFNTNEASDFQNLEATVLQSTLKHSFDESLDLNLTVRYLDNERGQAYHEPRDWVDINGDGEGNINDGVIAREYRDQFRANEEYSVTLDIVKRFSTGNIEHQFLVGADFHDVDTEFDYLRARTADGVLNLNIFNPNYGETDPSSYNLRDLNRDGTTAQRYGLYAQNMIAFNDHWSLMLGARFDDFEDVNKATGFTFSDDNIAPRFGLTYKPNPNGSIYLNYSESFRPTPLNTQDDITEGGALDPERGSQWELGWKQSWLDGRLLGTVALYQIVKEDLAQQNPNDTGPGDGLPERVNLGEVESEGVELTLVGDITPHWTITANYAWNDTVVTRGASIANTFGDDRREFANAPDHQVGIWTRYELSSIQSSIAFGMDYVGEQTSLSGQRVKPFTVFDASWTTTWEQFEFQLNVVNIFDEEFAVSGFIERTGHFPGRPTELVGQVRYNF